MYKYILGLDQSSHKLVIRGDSFFVLYFRPYSDWKLITYSE